MKERFHNVAGIVAYTGSLELPSRLVFIDPSTAIRIERLEDADDALL